MGIFSCNFLGNCNSHQQICDIKTMQNCDALLIIKSQNVDPNTFSFVRQAQQKHFYFVVSAFVLLLLPKHAHK